MDSIRSVVEQMLCYGLFFAFTNYELIITCQSNFIKMPPSPYIHHKRKRSSPRREGSFFRSAVERLMSRFNFDFFKIRCAMLADRAYEIRRQFLTVIDIATDTASPDCLCLLAGRRCLLLWLDMLLIKSIGR